jgi:hypothetical protein
MCGCLTWSMTGILFSAFTRGKASPVRHEIVDGSGAREHLQI